MVERRIDRSERVPVIGACTRRGTATSPARRCRSGPRPSACRARRSPRRATGTDRRARATACRGSSSAARCTRDSRDFFKRSASAFAPLSSENAASCTAKPLARRRRRPCAGLGRCRRDRGAGCALALGAAAWPSARGRRLARRCLRRVGSRFRRRCGVALQLRHWRCVRRRCATSPAASGIACRTSAALGAATGGSVRGAASRRRLRRVPWRLLGGVLRAVLVEPIDELAVVDRRNLHRDVFAERLRIAFEQHRHDDRGGEREHDRADQAAARAAPQFVDVDVGRFGHRSRGSRAVVVARARRAPRPR